MKEKTIIFDFDGVIADTFYSVMKIMGKLCREFGFRRMKANEVEEFRDKSAKEIFKTLGITKDTLPHYLEKVRYWQSLEVKNTKIFPGIKKTLIDLKKTGFRLRILSSNSLENIKKFLEINSIDLKIFDFIAAEIGAFGKGKIISELLKEKSLEADEVFYIVDEARDIEAAKEAGIKTIAVTWGYNSKKALLEQKPDYFVDRPEEILKILPGD